MRGSALHICTCIAVAATLVPAGALQAAQVSVEVQGLPEALETAARSALELTHYVQRDVSETQVRRLFSRGEQQIQAALEPFGYYHASVRGELTHTQDVFKALFTVQPGERVRVAAANVRVNGVAAELGEIKAALDAFEPGVGDPLEHAAYESSKTRIDTALRSAGFLDAHLLEHRVAVTRATNTARIDLVWDSGMRYRLGEVRYSPSQFQDGFLQRYVPWQAGDDYSTAKLLGLQQRLVDADYFSSVAVQPLIDQKEGDTVPVEVLVVPAKRTVYTAGVYMSTDTGPGVRLGMDRRWVNRRGHKFRADLEYSQRLQSIGTTYQIPRPGPDNRSYNIGAAYRDEETDTSRSRMLRLAANDSRDWRGYTRTLGLQYLAGDYEIAGERRNSSLLFAEGVLSRKKADDFFFTWHGSSLALGLRGAPETPLSDTTFLQASADAKWIRRITEDGRALLRAGLGAMLVDDFDALPPELRFFAGGDRTVRGFAYEEIGETNASGGVIGGKYLAYAGIEYEHYFLPQWGAAAFTDAGDAFSSNFDVNVSVGIGLRWKSPVGLVRLDFAKPVVTDLDDGFRIHVIIGPDL